MNNFGLLMVFMPDHQKNTRLFDFTNLKCILTITNHSLPMYICHAVARIIDLNLLRLNMNNNRCAAQHYLII